jgi:hypothetical protein
MVRLLAIILLAIRASAAFAETPSPSGMTGASLYALCINPIGSPDDNLCLAYIVGFAAGLAVGDVESGQGRHVCIPDGVTGTQFETLVRNYMSAHPEKMALQHAGALVGIPLYLNFPCN